MFICNLLRIRSVPSLKIKSSCNPLIPVCFVALLTSEYFLARSHIVACQTITRWPVKIILFLDFYNGSRKSSQSQFLSTLANILNMKSWGSFIQDNILIFIKKPLVKDNNSSTDFEQVFLKPYNFYYIITLSCDRNFPGFNRYNRRTQRHSWYSCLW